MSTSTGLSARPGELTGPLTGLPAGPNVQYQVGYTAEDPRVAAYRMGLIEEARQLYNMPLDLPAYEVAGESRGQIQAADLARQGIGAYEPYLQAGSEALTQGQTLSQQAANLAGNLNVAPEYLSAQEAVSRGLGAADLMAGYSTTAGGGLDEVRSGIGGLQYARQILPNYLQADLSQANRYQNEAATTASAAVPSNFTEERGFLTGAQGTAALASREAAAAALRPEFAQGIASLQQAADQAQAAARLGQAPTATAASIAGIDRVGAERVGQGGISAAQTGYAPQLQTFQMGPAQQVTTQSFGAPGTAEGMMSPYMQNVVAIQQREAQRQADIARQGRAAQAVRAGAFGGTREGVVEAEAQRNLATQLGDIQAQGLQQAYQQAQQQFNTEQQARLAAQQANQAAGLTVGQQNLAAQLGVQQLGAGQIGLQTSLANLSNEQQARVQSEANRLQAAGMNQQSALQAALANQQTGYNQALQNAQFQQQAALANQALQGQYGLQGAQLAQQAAGLRQALGQGQLSAAGTQAGLGLQAAAQRFQQAGFDANTAMQMAQLEQTQQAQGLQQAGVLQGLGSLYGQQALQQTQLGQAGAQLYGALSGQEAQLGGMLPSQIAQSQAAIDAQRAGLYGTLGQGLGGLAAQRAGIDLQRAGTLGQMGQGIGQLGVQQGALGQAATQLGQADVSAMMGIGAMEQANRQAQLDAIRATSMMDTMAPFQQLGFVSDIYRGAPSTQSSLIASSMPSASPFQTAAGLGIAGLGTLAGMSRLSSAGTGTTRTGLVG